MIENVIVKFGRTPFLQLLPFLVVGLKCLEEKKILV